MSLAAHASELQRWKMEAEKKAEIISKQVEATHGRVREWRMCGKVAGKTNIMARIIQILCCMFTRKCMDVCMHGLVGWSNLEIDSNNSVAI